MPTITKAKVTALIRLSPGSSNHSSKSFTISP
jgi:hypothetical protein